MISPTIRIGLTLLAVLFIAGLGYRLGYDHEHRALQALQAERWQERALQASAARQALERQLKQAQDTSRNNKATLDELRNTTAAIVADRNRSADLARRLLNRPAPRARACGDHLPETLDQSRVAAEADAEGTRRLVGLLADAAIESRLNAASCTALINQLVPQL